MSAAYGYYSIEFLKSDGTVDTNKAKEAFDWCSKNYEWFSENEPFVLEGHKILYNEYRYMDGLPVKSTFYHMPSCGIHSDSTPLKDWILEMGKAITVEIILGSFLIDASESDYNCNWNVLVSYKNGECTVEEIAFNSKFCAKEQRGIYYALAPDTYAFYRGKFRNKKSGKELLAGYVALTSNSDEDYDEDERICKFVYYDDGDMEDDEPLLCNADGNYIISGYEVCSFDHFSDSEYDIITHFIADTVNEESEEYGNIADWEFVGFSGDETLFDRVKKTDEEIAR